MNLRGKLKNTKKPELELDEELAIEFDSTIFWSVGSDLPISWDKKGLRQCEKSGLRANYKLGYFSKGQYKKALKELNAI